MTRRPRRTNRDMNLECPEKNFSSLDQNEMTAASCLNRIFKNVDMKGFSKESIENIARKCTVEYVLSGRRPDFDAVVKYCDEEKIGSEKKTEKNKIGF